MVDAHTDFLPLIVTSPSGAGKTTLVRRMLDRYPDMAQSVSVTTRAPREGEVDGRDYHFVRVDEFRAMESRGAFAEWAEVHGHLYGTSLEKMVEARARLRGMVFVIDTQGARQLKARVPEAVGVFVLPPSLTELERRLRGRGTDSEETIARRMRNALGELTHYGLFDYVVLNDGLDEASEELCSIVRAERVRRTRRAVMIERVIRGGAAR
ncbi:MAG: guanylate kinase [Polyangiales bacterium]